jgi:hypothetical protein
MRDAELAGQRADALTVTVPPSGLGHLLPPPSETPYGDTNEQPLSLTRSGLAPRGRDNETRETVSQTKDARTDQSLELIRVDAPDRLGGFAGLRVVGAVGLRVGERRLLG